MIACAHAESAKQALAIERCLDSQLKNEAVSQPAQPASHLSDCNINHKYLHNFPDLIAVCGA